MRKVANEDPLPSALVRVAQLLLKILFSQENETQLRLLSHSEAALSPPATMSSFHGSTGILPKGFPWSFGRMPVARPKARLSCD